MSLILGVVRTPYSNSYTLPICEVSISGPDNVIPPHPSVILNVTLVLFSEYTKLDTVIDPEVLKLS